jgi:hypothetical protein
MIELRGELASESRVFLEMRDNLHKKAIANRYRRLREHAAIDQIAGRISQRCASNDWLGYCERLLLGIGARR